MLGERCGGAMIASPTRRSAKGGKRAVVQPRPSVNSLEKRFALLSLQLLASLDRSSLDFGDFGEFASPSSKASSEDSTRARAGSYHLSADPVTLAHNLRHLSDSRQGKKLSKVNKKRRRARSQ